MSTSEPETAALPRLAPRKPDSHKGDYGRALLVGGSRGMSGAISLAGLAAMRTGAGLVTLAIPDSILETVASFDPCYMTQPLPDDSTGRIALVAQQSLSELVQRATCVGCGPGVGRSTDLTELILGLYRTTIGPMVLDADALFALAQDATQLTQHSGARILTPHPGEFRRLVAEDFTTRDQMEDCAVQFAESNNVVVVLKGHRTLVTDGKRKYQNSTGNPGMATGGSGDVLTGIITALVCQGLDPLAASIAGVHVHGAAGDLAAEESGPVSLIATDLIRHLPKAMRAIS